MRHCTISSTTSYTTISRQASIFIAIVLFHSIKFWETERLLRLTNNALELGRLQTTREHTSTGVDLTSLVNDAVAQMNPEAQRKEIDLVTTIDAALPPAWGGR